MPLTVDKTVNPIKVTGTTSASTQILADHVYIRFVYWYQPTTVGHLLMLKDSSGTEIVPAYCENPNESQWLPVFSAYSGVYCDDLDSGTLYIYIA